MPSTTNERVRPGALCAAWCAVAVGGFADPCLGVVLAAVGLALAASFGSGGPAGDSRVLGPAIVASAVAFLGARAGVAPLGPAASGALALALWAGSCIYIRALTQGLGQRLAPWCTLVVCGGLLALDPLASQLTGPVGGLLDVVAPGRALRRSAMGALDARDLLVLVAPGLIAAAGRRGLGATAAHNDRLRLVLVPIALSLTLAVLRPIPLLVDLSGVTRFSLGEARANVLSSFETPVLLTVMQGPDLRRPHRDACRALRDLLPALERAATSAFSTTWTTTDEPGLHLGVRAIDAVRSSALDGPDSVGWELALLLTTARGGPSPVVAWIGAPPSAEVRASLRGATLDVTAQVNGPRSAAAVVLRATTPLTEGARYTLDQHVMGGGGLVMLLGAGDGSDTPGANLIGPWGLGVGQPIGHETRAELTEHPAVRGLIAPTAPAETQHLHETEGLTERLVMAAGAPVALALSGSVPSGVAAEPQWSARSPLAMSDGAVRVIAISDALVERNPALLGRGVDWVLGRDEHAAMRPPVPGTADWGQRLAGILLAMGLGWVLARFGRPAGEGS